MDQRVLRVAVAQGSFRPGDIDHNLDLIAVAARDAAAEGAQLLVTPELALCGYTVGPRFHAAAIMLDSEPMRRLLTLSHQIAIAVGFIEETPDARFFNSAAFLADGRICHVHRKVYLPTYGGFDEGKYFARGDGVRAFDTPWGRMAMLICADAWHPSLPYLAAHDGADTLIVMAASPYKGVSENIESFAAWQRLTRTWGVTMGCFVVFANHGGAEGPTRFNGRSHLVAPDGSLYAQTPGDEPCTVTGDLRWLDLRAQRIALPFRRDDHLELTVRGAQRVLERRAAAEEAPLPQPALAPADAQPDIAGRIGPQTVTERSAEM